MTDDTIISEYCASPELMLNRYTALMVDGKMMATTPVELAAVLIRIEDGTINKNGAIKVIDELERRNKVFVKFVNETFGELV